MLLKYLQETPTKTWTEKIVKARNFLRKIYNCTNTISIPIPFPSPLPLPSHLSIFPPLRPPSSRPRKGGVLGAILASPPPPVGVWGGRRLAAPAAERFPEHIRDHVIAGSSIF